MALGSVLDPLSISHAPERVEAYQEAMRLGSRFPPISIVRIGHRSVVADGHKRFAAYRTLGRRGDRCGSLAVSQVSPGSVAPGRRQRREERQNPAPCLRESTRSGAFVGQHPSSLEARRALSGLPEPRRRVAAPPRSPGLSKPPEEQGADDPVAEQQSFSEARPSVPCVEQNRSRMSDEPEGQQNAARAPDRKRLSDGGFGGRALRPRSLCAT